MCSRQGEEVARLTQLLAGLTEREREEGDGLTGEGEDGGVPRIALRRGKEGSGRGRCGEEGARGGLLIGARGKGSGGARRAPVRCTAPALMPHSAAEGTPRWGGTDKDAGQGEGRTERCQTSLCGEMAEGRTEATAGGDFGEGTADGRRSS